MMTLLEEASQRYGITAACQVMAVPRSWYYRQKLTGSQNQENPESRPRPQQALSEVEKVEVRTILNSERFADESPREVYATLLDEGRYLCHWRTMYRVLAEHEEVRERRNQRQHPQHAKPQLLASRPNELWSWDITLLKGLTRRLFYYLYVILDVYSRFVVGWTVAQGESSELAEILITATCDKQNIRREQLTLHADRGSAMRAQTIAQLLADLGVTKSHSRPYTPDDNPYSEAQFKTMKYRPNYPDRFESLDQARSWARAFFPWYNYEHHHTGLGLMTPAVVHYEHVDEVRAKRQRVLDDAYAAHPERFVRGRPIAPNAPDQVWINPPPPATIAGTAPTETRPVAEVMSTVGPAIADNGELLAVGEGTLWPSGEEKSSLFSNSELFQNA
jgi:putative transposase